MNILKFQIIFFSTILNRIQADGDFASRILWSDEFLFTRDAVFNSHNLVH